MPDLFDDNTLELSARLSLHESLLETLHFYLFRNMPDPEAELNQFRDYLLDQIRNRRPAVQSQLPVHLVPLLTERMAELAENFVLKVSKRMEE